MKTSGQLIKIDKHDLESYRRQKAFIDAWNQKMVMLRQKQIYTALNQATKTKIDFFQKVSNWMNLLESKVFNQNTIDSMDLNKAISLIKFVSTVSLKLMAQMNDMEEVFKAYVELNSNAKDLPPVKKEDDGLGDAKKELYEILAGIAKDNSTTVTPVETEKIESSEPEIINVNLVDEKEKADILADSEKKRAEPEDSALEIVDIDIKVD